MQENKQTREDLKTMSEWSLQRKIQVTQTRIMEWYQHYEGQVYVSFSGGKDSTVLLDLARRIYPDIEAVFIDTGLEFPEIREFVKTYKNVTTVKPKMRFDEVIKKYGYPVISKEQAQYIREYRTTKSEKLRKLRWDGNEKGYFKISNKWKHLVNAPFQISEQCCDVMKKRPVKIFEKETGKKPIVGTMTCESRLRATDWVKNGCNSFSGRQISKPMSFWTEQDVLTYLKTLDIPFASVYGEIIKNENGDLKTTGEDRTGCMFCMFGCHLEKGQNRFQRMEKTHPKQHDYCIRSVDKNGLGLGEVLDYLDIKYTNDKER